MFRHIGFLRCHADNVDQILEDFKAYKLAVPTYGGIILNEDMSKVLLVLGFWSKTSWGFPKGKVNEDEPPHLCAVREVLEETGYDISDRIDPDEFIAKEITGQRCCLYMVSCKFCSFRQTRRSLMTLILFLSDPGSSGKDAFCSADEKGNQGHPMVSCSRTADLQKGRNACFGSIKPAWCHEQ